MQFNPAEQDQKDDGKVAPKTVTNARRMEGLGCQVKGSDRHWKGVIW